MEGIDKAKAISELHKACTAEQARSWMLYWAGLIHQDHGLAALSIMKTELVAMYHKLYMAEERKDAAYDTMEAFNHEGEDEDE